MCGIAGMVTGSGAVAADPVVSMLGALAHRGPDGGGLAVVGRAVFGHRRLAIHDLTPAGCQPFVDHEAGLVAAVNGEFYGADARRADLAARGHRFHGRSDSEIVLPLWREKGPLLVSDLHGPFALAIADARRGVLFLARDRVGKKPLFWTRRGDAVLFSSELGSLCRAAEARPRRASALEVLRMGYVPAPATPFEDVHSVPPGCGVLFEDGVARTTPYWEPPLSTDASIGASEAARLVRDELRGAVARRLPAERPMGVLLSGGLDSAAVLLLANEVSPVPLPAFTLGFDGAPEDEAPWARAVARALGSPHDVFPFDGDPAAILKDAVAKTGEMLADSSLIAWAHLSRRAAEHAVVFLTGDGGDEALIGYRRHRAARIAARTPALARALARACARLPLGRGAARALAGLSFGPRAALADLAALAPWRTLSAFLHDDALRAGDPLARIYDAIPRAAEPAADAARVDLLTYLPGDLMPKADRGAMASGIETRSPFLDDAFLEAVLRIPGGVRASLFEGKRPLRAMLRGRIPESVLRRGKRGFAIPLDRWLRSGPLARLAGDLLHDVRAPFAGVLAGDSAQPLHDAFSRGAPVAPLVYAAAVVALHHELWSAVRVNA
jgi:asparagine synthase (glutamine-hydrolysing)